MIITDVHSDICVSGIVFDAFPGQHQHVEVQSSAMVDNSPAGDTDGAWHWPVIQREEKL